MVIGLSENATLAVSHDKNSKKHNPPKQNCEPMSLKKLGWQKENPFMPDMQTTEHFKEYIEQGGVGSIEGQIEAIFRRRLEDLQEKIIKLKSIGNSDKFVLDIITSSILVDTRALFLENERYKRNATLQNIYRARGMNDKADDIDRVFNEKKFCELSLRDVVKQWVDQRIVHIDWLWREEEDEASNKINALFSESESNLQTILLKIIEDYMLFISQYGKNKREHLDLLLQCMTGDLTS